MKALLIGIAAAGLVGVTGVSAHDQKKDKTAEDTSSSSTKTTASDSSMSQTPSSSSSATQSPSSSSTATQSPSSSSSSATTAGTSASASNELSGTVKKVDKDKQSLKISSTTGAEKELKLGSSVLITRDGSQATLDQIKEGDQVRASLNASGDQASKIEVQSKAKSSDDKSLMKSESKEKK